MEDKKKVKTPWYDLYNGVRKHLDYPDHSLYEQLRLTCLKYPNYTAYNYFGKKSTFKNLISKIDECARALKVYGIKKKDKVTICMPNTPEAIISFYAINKIGAVANMIHPLSAENEIKYYLDLSKSKMVISIDLAWVRLKKVLPKTKVKNVVLVSVKDSMPTVLGLGYYITQGKNVEKPKENNSVIYWDTFIKKSGEYEGDTNANLKGSDDAAILYSGGTTGTSKGIVLTNLNFNALAMQSYEACACLKPKMKVLSIMPIFHGFGLGICIHTVLTFGMTAIILPQFSAKTFDKLLKKYRPNVIAGVPTLYEALLKNKNLDKVDLSYIKCAISGGDSLSVSLKKKVDKFLNDHGANIQVREGYGLTECVTGSCLTPLNTYKEGSIGIPYPDTYYKIVKPGTTDEVPYGKEGEIVLSGPTVMKGYLHNEKETKETIKKHKDGLLWLHTGDLGYMDKNGYVYFKQRLKRIIISSGYNLYPQRIENVIDELPFVLMSCVIGVDHPYKVQVAKAFVVLKDDVEPNETVRNEIYDHCAKNLAKYSLPYEIEFRKSLPKTLVGKVAYRKLEEEEKNKK
jgi:long-chain acyl-CoA synthetase